MTMSLEMRELLQTMPQVGSIQWIGVRPERGADLIVVEHADLTRDDGLSGDRFDGGNSKQRQVTLIQSEHLDVVAQILQTDIIDPGLTRRNIVVSGINLQALKDQQFRIGSATLFGTGNCPPCSRMEENLGPGGYNAMRGHGGLTARVVEDGEIRIGDKVTLAPK